MNNLLIEKLVKSNNETCPELTYSNPLLDKNVTKALSKSLINILKLSSQNSNVNNSLRLSVLENIRKLCVYYPEDHLKFDDNITELLITLYIKQIQESYITEPADQAIEFFFVTHYKELNLNLSSKCIQNPEVFQALLNLSNKKYLDIISKSVIHWNIEDPRYYKLAKELWNNKNYKDTNLQNTLSMKVKCDIEKCLLEVSHYVLENKDSNFEKVISHHDNFNNITKISSNLYDCFQICCSIFNFIFIISNFDSLIQNLIEGYVKEVKLCCKDKQISLLYPVHLRHIVVLLDIEICDIPSPLKEVYIQTTVKYLKEVHTKSETDLILLLSHFPFWFDVYFCK